MEDMTHPGTVETENEMADIFRDIKTEPVRRLRERERPAEKVTIVKAYSWQRLGDMLGMALIFLLITSATGAGVYYWQRSMRERDRVLFETSMTLLTEKMDSMVAEFDRALKDIKEAQTVLIQKNSQLETRVQQLLTRNDQLQKKTRETQNRIEEQQKSMALQIAESRKELESVQLDKAKLQFLLETIERKYGAETQAWIQNPPLHGDSSGAQSAEDEIYHAVVRYGSYPEVPRTDVARKNTSTSWVRKLFRL